MANCLLLTGQSSNWLTDWADRLFDWLIFQSSAWRERRGNSNLQPQTLGQIIRPNAAYPCASFLKFHLCISVYLFTAILQSISEFLYSLPTRHPLMKTKPGPDLQARSPLSLYTHFFSLFLCFFLFFSSPSFLAGKTLERFNCNNGLIARPSCYSSNNTSCDTKTGYCSLAIYFLFIICFARIQDNIINEGNDGYDDGWWWWGRGRGGEEKGVEDNNSHNHSGW